MGFGEQGNTEIYCRGTVEQRPKFERNRGTNTILGNREHRKQIFDFGGTGEQANRYPLWEGLENSRTVLSPSSSRLD